MVAGTSSSLSSYDTPKSASLRDILLAVQLPLLCKLNHNGTPAGEDRVMLGPFAPSLLSSDADMAELRRLFGVEFDANTGNDCAYINSGGWVGRGPMEKVGSCLVSSSMHSSRS